MKRLVCWGFLALGACGCWTFGTSEFPKLAVSAAKGDAGKLTLAVNGFETVFTEYEAIHGYSTVYVPGYFGYRHYRPGYYAVESTMTIIPQLRSSDMFLKRAREELEDAGFSLATAAAVPDVTVEVTFGHNAPANGDAWAKAGWMVLTVFFCDYDADEWTAKLRVRDNKTGKVVFKHEYVQRYETKAFGLVPIFSIAACDETETAYEQSWCLAALTDRAIVDVTAFLNAQ